MKNRSNKNTWMISQLFNGYLLNMDYVIGIKGRKILLILDRFFAHPALNSLNYIELCMLLHNSPSQIQPLDAGIIKPLKCHYRKK